MVSAAALELGALVPLDTRVEPLANGEPFMLRDLLSTPPRHLQPEGPRPNPFLPWDQPLEVARLHSGHVLLLNKYPVQANHLLVITQSWKPQAGWLEAADWQAVQAVSGDIGGLWFFNSEARAGASQPHRHLQILPRRAEEPSCPLAKLLEDQLEERSAPWPWAYRLSQRRDPSGCSDLADLYAEHGEQLGLGRADRDPQPLHPYNLLFDDRWFLTVRREREHQAGFSINALGFAGYLLSTSRSDRRWLESHGPWHLLGAVAAPGQGRIGR